MLIDAYIRVSQVKGRSGASFISPSLQLERIQRWADLHGATILEVHEELDESGGRRDRPLLLRALDRVETGQTGGIVVARMDRFGRSLLDGLAAIQRIDDAGGIFVSVDNGLDIRTDTGRLVLRLMLSLAEYELDRIRQSWEDSKRRAIERGVHLASVTPTGYTRTPSGLKIDPGMAPWVRGIFERRADGQSYGDITRWLEANGVRTKRGNTVWSTGALVKILANRVYLGEAHHGEYRNPDAHRPLIDRETFARSQRPLDRSATRMRQRWLLSGLVRCAHCQRLCPAESKQRGRFYGCHTHKTAGRCINPAYISAGPLEQHVLDSFRRRLALPSGTAAAIDHAEEHLAAAEADLAHYRDSARIRGVLGPARFEDGLERRAGKVQRMERDVAAARQRHAGPRVTADEWDSLDETGRCEVLRASIDCVFIVRAFGGSAADRTFVCWRGEAPPDLPVRNERTRLTAFDPRKCRGPAARRKLPAAFILWPEQRLRRELTVMVDSHAYFPQLDWFHRRDGGDQIYMQVRLRGGRKRWARELGLPLVNPHARRVLSDEQILKRLSPFVCPTGPSPTYGQLAAGGEEKLWAALLRRGGIEAWTERVRAGERASVTPLVG
jgi:DNA invertase Pin-like site-specific DNA recombinase